MVDDHPHITVSAIAAMAENKVIGKDNNMPWHIPEESKYFRRVTMGKPIIMGRKSMDAFAKPLPGRLNVVISRSAPTSPIEGVVYTTTVEDAIVAAKQVAQRDGKDEVFIIGGAQIYKAAMPYTEKFYLTVIHKNYDGDTFLTSFNEKDWATEQEEHHEAADPYPAYTLRTLKRTGF